jgi:CBS domain-containing protein
MQVKDCMKRNVVSVPSSATIASAAGIILRHRVGVLPVLDEHGKPVGVLQLSDLLSLEFPDFVKLVADVDFVHDFGAVETTRPLPELLAHPVTELMQPMITVGEDSGLLRAYALMIQHNVLDVPVVNASEELVGIASRVDIGTAILSNWSLEAKKP